MRADARFDWRRPVRVRSLRRMRALRTLCPALLLAALTLAGTARAQPTSTHLDYWWSGSAFQVDLLYAQTTRGLSLANRDSKEMVWYASCEHRYPGDRPNGTALHCTAHNGYVLGRIDDESPANADEDCSATMSYRPGYPLPMGADRPSRRSTTRPVSESSRRRCPRARSTSGSAPSTPSSIGSSRSTPATSCSSSSTAPFAM